MARACPQELTDHAAGDARTVAMGNRALHSITKTGFTVITPAQRSCGLVCRFAKQG